MEKSPNAERNIRRYNAYAQYRDALGFTDYYISKKCGLSRSTLYDWRNGRFCPSADSLMKICKEVNASVEDILID